MNNEEQLFTLIAYKPESSTSSRGCLIDQWSADQEVILHLTEKQLIEYGISFLSKPLDDGEVGYTLTTCSVTDGKLVTCEDLVNSVAHSDIGIEDATMSRIRAAIMKGTEEEIARQSRKRAKAIAEEQEREKQYKIKQDLVELKRRKKL